MNSGAMPEVGKSLISSNLAAVIAQAGQKVLVADGVMRKGYIQKIFNQKWEGDLSELLRGDLSFTYVIKQTSIDNHHLVTQGQIPPNSSELLINENFSAFIEQASQAYELVIINTPPILAITDAAIIGNQAGTTLMLSRYEQSSLK